MDTLRKIPAALRFVSMEPLLEDISAHINFDGFSWAIAGGESGYGPEYLWNPDGNWREEFKTGGRRTMKLEWARNLHRLAQERHLPFLFKQITAPRPGQGEAALGSIIKEFPKIDGKWAEIAA
jgi:protein gp37